MGFNFYKGSRRFIAPERAAEIWRQAALTQTPHSVTSQPVAVIVDWSHQELVAAIEAFPELAVLQFHGSESPADLVRLAAAGGQRPVWKAYGVGTADDLGRARRFLDSASLVLFDSAQVPQGSTVAGGSGKSFDWSWLSTVPSDVAFGLAGGINLQNLRDALQYRPRLIDLCSGVESAPGIKDHAMIDAFAREMHYT